jgi:hypothetical protein
VAAVDKQLRNRDEFLDEIKSRLVQAQVTMKHTQDKSRRDVHYNVGDWVWLRLQQRKALGVTAASPSKLGPKFYGPYQIMQRIGEVSYKLQLPPRARIHDVFHVALLKKFEGTAPSQLVPLPDILHGRVIPSPDKVVKARLNRGIWELLVQWVGRAATDASWEQLEEFKQQYPHIQLADELFVGEGGNVIDSFLGRQYQRRRQPSIKKGINQRG